MSSVTVLWMHPGCYPAQSLRARLRLRELHGLPSGASRYQMASPKWQAMHAIRKRQRERRGCAGKQNALRDPTTRTDSHSSVCGDFH